MLKTSILLAKFARLFPKRLAKKYDDFVGLMTGKLPKTIQTVYVALDLEPMHLPEILKVKPDLVITHHPFIYGTRLRVLKQDVMKRKLVEALDRANIPVYSLHTNFDEGQGGMNDALAMALNLTHIHSIPNCEIGRGGTLAKPMTIRAFAQWAKRVLRAKYGLLVAKGKSIVNKVALVGGGGSRDVMYAIKADYDVFISGDFPHHIRRLVINHHFNYLDLPHEIEEIFLPTMTHLLRSLDATMTIVCAPYQEQAEVI
jgi:dinuclear metal center YbgI/SA1388 family protein